MELGLSPGDFVLDGDPAPLPKRRWSPGAEPPPQFSAHVYCGQTAGCIKMPLGMEIGLSPGDFVLDGNPAPTPKGAERHPFFGSRLLWPNSCMDQDATWYGGRPRRTQHCVRCGPSYPQKKGTPMHPILAIVQCGQMAGWMKSPLGTEVDLGSGHTVLDGVPAPAKGAQQRPPLFGPCLLWPRSPISATAELL